jgi:DNA polymerase III subunit beta
MKFSVSSTELQKVIGGISGVIPPKSTLPILENVLLELSKNELVLTATDLEISMSVNLKVNGTEDGKIAVPAKRLFETVRSLPNTNITFTADLGNSKVSMLTENGEYKLTGELSENYPSVPAFKGEEELKIEKGILQRVIGKTVFAVSSDELRPAMMGIFFQMKKDGFRAVATDGHRLVKLENSKLSLGKAEREVIVPAKAMSLVLKAVEDKGCVISFNETHAKFSIGNMTLISRLIEEKYPNYESVIPLDNEKKLTVDKNALLSSVNRTSLYASSTTHQVRMTLKKNSLTVSAEDIDFGSEAKETLSCEYTFEPLDIGFNASYIVEILSHVDTEEVVFLLSSSTRACIVTPAKQLDGEQLLMLVMPVRLNG